jgi:hypothetical protein
VRAGRAGRRVDLGKLEEASACASLQPLLLGLSTQGPGPFSLKRSE